MAYTLSVFLSPFWKGERSKLFPLQKIPFLNDIGAQESKQEVVKIVSLDKTVASLTSVY